jgi:hypothetical protein
VKEGEEEIEVSLEELMEDRKVRKGLETQVRGAIELRDNVQKFLKDFEENPVQTALDYLTHKLGDPNLATRRVIEKFGPFLDETWKYENMPPEQKEAIRLKKENARLTQERDRLNGQVQERARMQEDFETTRRVTTEVNQAMDKVGLAKDPRIIRVVAEQLLVARRQGRQLSAEQAATNVKRQLSREVDERLKALDAHPERLLELFPNAAKALASARLAQVRTNLSAPVPIGQKPAVTEKKDGQVKSKVYRDFEDLLKS